LDELLAQSDIVSFHAPDFPATRNMIGAHQLALLRDGTTCINAARGRIVDHEALLEECRSGLIVAALDVTHPEPLPPNSPFGELPNLLLLAHITGRGEAGLFQIGEKTRQAQCAVPLERWEFLP